MRSRARPISSTSTRTSPSGCSAATSSTRPSLAAPIGDWAGPFRSGYGWHLIRVTSERPSRELPFEEVRERVEQNYLDSRRGEVNQAAFDELARKYQVVEERS
jgi:hypothetical protein